MNSDLPIVDIVWLDMGIGLVALGGGVGAQFGVGIALCTSVLSLA